MCQPLRLFLRPKTQPLLLTLRRMASFTDVQAAFERISPTVHRTPVMTCSTLDAVVGREVFLKCENLQKTGSFKARGALNAVLKLKEKDQGTPGVVTHSSGNHGQAVAWAARVAGLPCSVVVPENTPSIKCEAIKGYGARLVFCKPSPQDRVDTCQSIADETGQCIIPPYEHYDVIAGQGTIAVELLQQVPDLDAILVPISGGGMTSGIAIATKSIHPATKVFVVEAKGKELEPCLRSGKRLWKNPPQFVDTIAEGIRQQQVGHLTFPIVLEHVEKDVFTISNEEMIEAMQFTMQYTKQVIEASSGAAVAAVMSDRMRKMPKDMKKIGVILCGGNCDVKKLPWY